MFKKKNKNYGSYDELHEGIVKNRRDKDEWYPHVLDSPSRDAAYPYGELWEFSLSNNPPQPLTVEEAITAGIFQRYNGKLIPGAHANKRFIKTHEGVEFYPEYVERKIKEGLYNTLVRNNAPHMVDKRRFLRMSIDEIDSMYDPTKRQYGAKDTIYKAQEKEFERRRKVWEVDARKKGRWWTDFAKQTIKEAYQNSTTEYDKNLTALALRAQSATQFVDVKESMVEKHNFVRNMPTECDNTKIEAKEPKIRFLSHKKKRKKLKPSTKNKPVFKRSIKSQVKKRKKKWRD